MHWTHSLGEIGLERISAALPGLNWDNVINFKVILLSIVLEALPFVLLSVIVSAFLHNFVSDDFIRRIIPKSKLLSIVPAAFLGILFPVCDCGMVPIVRRLVMKGVPLHAAVSFMLAAPIINPVVTAATAFAFKANMNMVVFRLGTALFTACFSGWLISILFKSDELKSAAHTHHHGCGCAEHDDDFPSARPSFADKLLRTVYDASNEFFEMGKYLILGAIMGALAQIVIPRVLLLAVGQNPVLSIGVMMLFAFVISVCSAADAFIAASFVTSFSPGSLIAFMVFGPMIDLKNILMLLHSFRARFVLSLVAAVVFSCTVSAYLINHL
ncbi:MAG: permease [Negativicutes bacterium]|nr:permease [Negativicutes bacterium]MDR3589937.1 permease [Negativicutes bacterium]